MWRGGLWLPPAVTRAQSETGYVADVLLLKAAVERQCLLCVVQLGRTALLLVCANGRLDVAQWLVASAGSDARSERSNVGRRCVVLVCCDQCGNPRGSGVWYVCKQDGHTALLFACANGRLDVAQWLVSSAGSDARSERSNVRIAGGAVVACARSRSVGGFL
jgi:hypothetical protein